MRTGFNAMNREHVGELKLRRMFVGELQGAEADRVQAHTAACVECRDTLAQLASEQRAFESEIPFERFAAGVERARRTPRPDPRRTTWIYPALAIAAAISLAV